MTLQDALKRLFTRNVIIKSMPGNRLKAYDVNKSQSLGTPSAYNARAKWRSGRQFQTRSGYGSGFTNEEIETLRRQMYLDYELMDTDAIIHSSLDLIAEECLSTDVHSNEILVIKSDNIKIKKILHNLFYDVLNLEFNAFSWIRTMTKYGDAFLYLQIAPEYGVVNVMPIHPALMRREEGDDSDPNVVKFLYEGDGGFYRSSRNYFEQYEIAHFRLMSDSALLPYGMSSLEGARKDYRSLTLAEDAMLLHRIMRAPERRIFYVDVGNIAPEEVDAHMEQIITETKKIPHIDPATGQMNLQYNLQNMLEDIYLPVRGEKSGNKIDTLPGLANEGQLEDVNYLRKKMMSAMKIPPAYLGYGEEGTDTKSSLSSLDLRFGRSIERIQKIFVSELYKIAVVHLYVQGFEGEDLLNFDLELTSPSLIFERQKIDILTAKVDLIKSIKEDNIFSDRYIYENILGMTDDEIDLEMENIASSAQFKFRLQQIRPNKNHLQANLHSTKIQENRRRLNQAFVRT